MLARIFATGGAHPVNWDTLRAWGPTGARFDHHPPPVRLHGTRRVLYAAVSVPGPNDEVYPTLKTCLAECFRDRGIIEVTPSAPYYVQFDIVRPLRLLDLSDSDWVTSAGGNAAITSGPRGATRLWARAIYRRYPDLDGVFYASSNIPSARVCALWDRAEDAFPSRPSFHEPLDHIGLRPALELFAAELGLGLG